MSNYKVVIPNLAGREDRFNLCMGHLLAQGVPPEHIRRFFAHDGKHYTDAKHITNYVVADLELRHRYGNGRYLTTQWDGWDVYSYAWMWTWYEIVDEIAREPDELPPTLVLIDDWAMDIEFSVIKDHVSILSKMEMPFCMLQYVHSTSESNEKQSKRDNKRTIIPTIQHGIAGTGDPAMLITPLGARRLIDYADKHPQHCPEMLMWYFSRNGDNSGCYSAIENMSHNITEGAYNLFQDRAETTEGKHIVYEENQ